MNLDDGHIALLEAALANIENDYRPTCEQARYGNGCPGPTDASIDFWRRAVDCVPALIAELRALRLTDEEREALRAIAVEIGADCPIGNDGEPKEPHRTALAVLAKLTRGGQ